MIFYLYLVSTFTFLFVYVYLDDADDVKVEDESDKKDEEVEVLSTKASNGTDEELPKTVRVVSLNVVAVDGDKGSM